MAPRSPQARRALHVAMWMGGLVIVLVLAGMFLFDRWFRGKYEPTIAQFQKEATDNVGFFCEQQTLLAADPWFHEPRTEGDAGPLLNAWVQWEGTKELPKGSPLLIPAALPQKVGDFKDWLTSPVDVSTLDFGWMEQLHAYDRWDFVKDGPGAPGPSFNMATATIPNFLPLQLWAKFRLLHGMRTGQPLQAVRDVRHLAWLMYRTDTLIGAMVASTVLMAEHDAFQSMQSPPAGWRPMSTEQVERMRALFFSGIEFSNIAVPPEVARRARSCGEPSVTRCAALAEAGAMLKLLLPLALGDYAAEYSAFEADLDASQCPTSLPRTVWERGVTVDDEVAEKEMPERPKWMRNLPRPFFGSRMAGVIIAVGVPRFERLEKFRKALTAGEFKAER